jgi:hypothetical protein
MGDGAVAENSPPKAYLSTYETKPELICGNEKSSIGFEFGLLRKSFHLANLWEKISSGGL